MASENRIIIYYYSDVPELSSLLLDIHQSSPLYLPVIAGPLTSACHELAHNRSVQLLLLADSAHNIQLNMEGTRLIPYNIPNLIWIGFQTVADIVMNQ